MVPVLAILGLGAGELVIFGLIVLVLFGSRLPSVMRSLGQSVTSFKTGLHEGEDEKPDETARRKEKKVSDLIVALGFEQIIRV